MKNRKQKINKIITPILLGTGILLGTPYVAMDSTHLPIYVNAASKSSDGVELLYPSNSSDSKTITFKGLQPANIESITIKNGSRTYIEIQRDPDIEKEARFNVSSRTRFNSSDFNQRDIIKGDNLLQLSLEKVYRDMNNLSYDIVITTKQKTEIKFNNVILDFTTVTDNDRRRLDEIKKENADLELYKKDAISDLRRSSRFQNLTSDSLRVFINRIERARSKADVDNILVSAETRNTSDRRKTRLDDYKKKINREIDKLDYLDNFNKTLFKEKVDEVKLLNNDYEAAETKIDNIKIDAVKQSEKNSNMAVPVDAAEGDSVIKIRLPKDARADYTLTMVLNNLSPLNYNITSRDVSRGYVEIDLGTKLFRGDKLALDVFNKFGRLISDRNDGFEIIERKETKEDSSRGSIADDRVRGSIKLERIFGTDRFNTSIDIANTVYPNGVDTVILANSSTYYDILGAMAFADNIKSPILYTSRDNTPSNIVNTIKKLRAKKIIVIGGENSVSASQYDNLKQMGYNMERIGGENRYETSALMAERVLRNSDKNNVIIASSSNYADALSVSSYAFKNNAPILLVESNRIPTDTRRFLSKYSPSLNITVVGGENSVSKSVERELDTYTRGTVKRLSGKDRYDTSTAISREANPKSTTAIVTSGENYVDALVSGGLVRKYDAPILLVEKNNVPLSIVRYITNSDIDKIVIVGGTGSITDSTQIKIGNIK